MVKLEEVKRKPTKKEIIMSIRTTQEISDFMKKHDISPSLVFHKAIEELMINYLDTEITEEGDK